jgi:quercetin dioxygenase-like cupin family protein
MAMITIDGSLGERRLVPFSLAALMALAGALIAIELAPILGAGSILDWSVRAATSAPSSRPTTTARIVDSASLVNDPQKRVTSMIVDFPPNALAPEFHHEADVHVYVLQGTIRSQLAGQGVVTHTGGQSFFEPAGSTLLFAENTSLSDPARILVVFTHRDGARLTVFH